jgi:GNAT superfamily N-acetyltransferase
MSQDIRSFRSTDMQRCREILDALPDWFGISESNEGFLARLSADLSAVFESESSVYGFVSILRHNPVSIEVDVIAVDPERRGAGIGRQLMNWVEDSAREEDARWLHVKTRGPSTPDPHYEQTRAFYSHLDFDALFESTELWGPEDAALILIKRID